MGVAVFVFERGRPFDYRAFARHMVKCSNVMWEAGPGKQCYRPAFRTAVEVELGVDTDAAKDVVQTMSDLGMLHIYRYDNPNREYVDIDRTLR